MIHAPGPGAPEPTSALDCKPVAEEGPKWHLFLKERTLSRFEAILKEAGSNLTSSAYTEDGRIPTTKASLRAVDCRSFAVFFHCLATAVIEALSWLTAGLRPPQQV